MKKNKNVSLADAKEVASLIEKLSHKIKVDKGVIMTALAEDNMARFPFKEMEVGDSFWIPCDGLLDVKQMQSKIMSRARYYILKYNLPVKFRSRSFVENKVQGVRTWRIR